MPYIIDGNEKIECALHEWFSAGPGWDCWCKDNPMVPVNPDSPPEEIEKICSKTEE